MAYLNVRERRIETKIAYVGPELAGKTTNFAQLQTDIARGRASDVQLRDDILSLEWRPRRMTRISDCDLAVTLVAPKGALSAERLDTILEDADGVVIVVDAGSSEQDENRRAVRLVREALSRASTPSVPVVLQLNKSDVAGAIGADDVADVLGAPNDETWPIITASAARGVGVVETLEMALANVINAMNSKPPTAESRATAGVETNPFLGALRDILRETVTEHMAHVERATAERIVAVLGERLAHTEAALDELKRTAATSAREMARALEVQGRAINELASRIEELQSTLDLCTQADLTGHEEGLREELARVCAPNASMSRPSHRR
ncbi:MAG TPA: hypothetical protein VM925_30075 [Labilithrix sp.]|nr:hypothetical protein [Labilithrix sp.]